MSIGFGEHLGIGLILGVGNHFDLRPELAQFLDQRLIPGVAEDQVVIPPCHLAGQGRQHVVPGFKENHDALS